MRPGGRGVVPPVSVKDRLVRDAEGWKMVEPDV